MVTIGDLARLGGVSVRMLRHYDAIGLLVPARVDSRTGRRSYELAQLARLNRLVVLKDLGFGLAEVAELLREPVDERRVRALLQERRAAMAVLVRDTGHRLAHVKARLRLIDGGEELLDDVQVKEVAAVRVVGLSSAVAVDADGLGGQVAAQFDRVGQVLDAAGASRLAPVSRFTPMPAASAGSTWVTTGYVVPEGDVAGLEVVELPAARVASVVHRGPMDAARVGWQTLARWAEGQGRSGAAIAAAAQRTVFLHAEGDDQAEWLVELQLELDATPAG
ncbi:MerR family transcriptional regulator [Modestobacter italicus]|uniref:MerR family transcriptional regulator n=1 Tax=Modestobacter italicus (strain DSM 44449 / CECT 9708 / BC 501) TaxID=2732864 RepID=UPI001C94E7B9|nr:MerR family transcriptional regulator [Modestobacter italicus]